MASNEEADDLWDTGGKFGQKVDLTRRIREILANYPEGIAVLKELIQNADDGKASVVRFIYDKRHHSISNLSHSKLSTFQNESLLVYNNGVFTESDFESIQRIGSSLAKRDDVQKTGRFGVGFNSVYHLTECPMFISDKYICYFDPQCKYLPNINPNNPGKRIDFTNKNAKLQMKKYKNQFITPFSIPNNAKYKVYDFGVEQGRPFNATLFRLSLRTKKQVSCIFTYMQSSNYYYILCV